MRCAPSLRWLLPPSAHELPELEYKWELLTNVVKEALPLLRRHSEEIEDERLGPLDPDWNTLFAWERTGVFQVLTVRDEGLLVGYIGWMIYGHPFYQTKKVARSQLFWLDPSYRSGWTGYKMFVKSKEAFKKQGVTRIDYIPKEWYAADRGGVAVLFKRLGAKINEICYSQWL